MDTNKYEALFTEVEQLHDESKEVFSPANQEEWGRWREEFNEFRTQLLGYDKELAELVDKATEQSAP